MNKNILALLTLALSITSFSTHAAARKQAGTDGVSSASIRLDLNDPTKRHMTSCSVNGQPASFEEFARAFAAAASSSARTPQASFTVYGDDAQARATGEAQLRAMLQNAKISPGDQDRAQNAFRNLFKN